MRKQTTITNIKGLSFAVDKQRAGYPSLYNHEQFLNTAVVEEFSGLFDEFFIDLTNIGAGSKAELDKSQLLQHFTALIAGDKQSGIQLEQMVTPSTHEQYIRGV